jgi:hypothetical protein
VLEMRHSGTGTTASVFRASQAETASNELSQGSRFWKGPLATLAQSGPKQFAAKWSRWTFDRQRRQGRLRPQP